jgi:hypothetical membrane protein
MTSTRSDRCAPPMPVKITRSLLGYGVLAGPFYVIVVAAQAATRAGFDPTRHPASVLANGPLGWIQITNFLLTGVMTIAAGVGVYRAIGDGGARWAGVLIAGYGIGLIAAGIFRADPMSGFPPGTPNDRELVSWHGMLHLLSAVVAFTCLVAACFVFTVWFARTHERGWAWFSGLAGGLFAATFVVLPSGWGGAASLLAFTAAVVLVWAWLAAVSVRLYRLVH